MKRLNEYVETDRFELGTAGYVREDGSLIVLDEYHGEEKSLRDKGYPEFSNTHPEEDTCIRLYKEPNNAQYATLGRIIDEYLKSEGYCKIEIFDDAKNSRYDFYVVFSLYEGACELKDIDEKIGDWTGDSLIEIVKRRFASRDINESEKKQLTSRDFLDFVELLSDKDDITYETFGDVSYSDVLLLSPEGDTIDATEYDTHAQFEEEVMDVARKKGLVDDKTWTGPIDDYIVEALGYITLNNGRGYGDDRCKIVVSKRPTPEQIEILGYWLDEWAVRKDAPLHVYVKEGYRVFPENTYSANDVMKAINRAVSTGVFAEDLKEGMYLDRERHAYLASSEYDARNTLMRNDKSYRVFYLPRENIYLIGDADQVIHRDMLEMAIESGYVQGYNRYEIDSYIDENDPMYIIYAPKGKEKSTYGSDLSEDGYDELYAYPFGTITTRQSEWLECPLSKLFGEYDAHKGLKWNDDKWTYDTVELESLNEVYPNKGESKRDFISRFMSVTKGEYPDAKQRYAVALSYWDRRKKNESLLVEKKRSELIDKSKNADNYASSNQSKGRNRWERRRHSHIYNSVRDYNQINMDAFWKADILEFGVKVHGETDDYVVTVTFENILDNLRDEVSANGDKMEFKCVLRALLRSFNEDDVYISCTCPDWRYRMSYFATKGQYNSGLSEIRPSDITNPNDTKGAGCKHSLLVLSNTDWMMKIASVINNYVKYCKQNMSRNYADYIFPKIYGMPYNRALQLSLFDDIDPEYSGLLPSDQKTLDDVIARGMRGKDDKGRFNVGNEYRFTKTKPDEVHTQADDNPLGLRFGGYDDVDDDVED